MFTGIIETLGKVTDLSREGSNLHLTVESGISDELKVDQSVAHNGICLTVTHTEAGRHRVTAIDETLQKTNLGDVKIGDLLNLERCLPADGRFDGHFVQGHVDVVGVCTELKDEDGSWRFSFEFPAESGHFTVEKGSITVNGVSLTVVNSGINTFETAIIPYTFEHTGFKTIRPGSRINLEFDILGKYMQKLLKMKELSARTFLPDTKM